MTAPERNGTTLPVRLSHADLTPDEARATTSESGYGVTLDGLHAYWPGIPCYVCGKFVGRDGHIGLCRRCIDAP